MFSKWKSRRTNQDLPPSSSNENENSNENEKNEFVPKKSHLGILSDPFTDEVPGSVILLSDAHKRNEPLGLRHARARTSSSSLPSPYGLPSRSQSLASRVSRRSSHSRRLEKKKTADGKFILEPQPDDSANDPLNWPQIRRDVALLSLGFYCMVGGGMTPLLAAGFHNVAETYNVSVPQVALTTGLYMLGLGLGSVVASPTAILWGKRPVYLVAIIVFCLSSVWCALSPNYPSLVVARIVQGFAVSPVECLPSATVAEIFFLHERAYRLGVYTLLLLGGKNLVPLVSAALIESLGWRWVFWFVAIVVVFCFFLILFFVPETFWDRTPRARRGRRRERPRSSSPYARNILRISSLSRSSQKSPPPIEDVQSGARVQPVTPVSPSAMNARGGHPKTAHFDFAADTSSKKEPEGPNSTFDSEKDPSNFQNPEPAQDYFNIGRKRETTSLEEPRATFDNIDAQLNNVSTPVPTGGEDSEKRTSLAPDTRTFSSATSMERVDDDQKSFVYTDFYREAPPKSYVQSLKPWNGRLARDKWLHVMVRPFILFAYPAVLWSSMVYMLAIGWLIVLSESVSVIYQKRNSYNFTSLQIGLVYISPFVGGVLGTAVAGKVSDIIVRFMARKNDGVYEPEFRLVMAIPITISTCIGLMGFGWSAEERDAWIVPTIFFGAISFGCSLASTTAVTFVVDSYRVYAGEALVTLNFSKNVFHGFVFSLFFTRWLESDGSKKVFLAVGGIQLGCMILTIPMYIYGKRARMWTTRKNLMEKF